MKKDPNIFLRHILESIERIDEFTRSISRKQFLNSVQIQDAVIRRLEIIGEAAKNIPNEFKKKYPNIPWAEMAKTRDKLIHGYFGVDLELTWDIVNKDLPDLENKIREVLKEARKLKS